MTRNRQKMQGRSARLAQLPAHWTQESALVVKPMPICD